MTTPGDAPSVGNRAPSPPLPLLARAASLGALSALAVACNALLGNSDRAFVDADASTPTTANTGDAASLTSGSVDGSSGSGGSSSGSSGSGGSSSGGSSSGPSSSGAGDDASCTGAGCAPPTDASCTGAGCPPPPAEPPSCAPGGAGMTNCGPSSESCCTSLEVSGGTYYRSYDGVTWTDKSNPATVSNFRLDQYDVTVGRFRQFVSAVVAGWLPEAGSGKHSYLNGGQGLVDTGASYEAGWSSSWTSNLPTTANGWATALSSSVLNGEGATWTAAPGANENLPISSVSWFQSYAFCIYDGGFLPSEAEWNYAATGGSDQRVYPWSVPSTSTAISCADSFYNACTSLDQPNAVGTESPTGDGKWGQSDMAGNLFEWVLDTANNNYVNPCVDCATLTAASMGSNGIRGGAVDTVVDSLLASARAGENPNATLGYIGFRCARAP
jgi:formylglycine-generating enzyme